MRAAKKSKLSFDVARADLGESRVGWVYRSDAPEPGPTVSPPAAPNPVSTAARQDSTTAARPETSRSWIETGLGVMGLPVTLTIAAMIAPVLWVLATRARR
jgi:hypothetical protein